MFLEMKKIIRDELRSATDLDDVGLVEGGEHADLASTAAFALAKIRKIPPARIADDIVTELSANPRLKSVQIEAKGPYVNFILGRDYIENTLKKAVKPGYGTLPLRGDRIILEHTSANPNGPLHVGHIRNTVIGDTLTRCFKKAGHRVEVQYYVNDMGRQIAILAWGFSHLESDRYENEKGDHHVARIYVAANRKIAENPELVKEIDGLMQMVEKGDSATSMQFRSVVNECLEGFKVTLQRLNAHHDRFVWESDFIRNGDTERILARIKRMDECHVDDTMWLDLSEFGFEKEYILRRSDGTSVYAARDLAYHIWKGRNYDSMIDVLGADHKLIGAQLVATLRLIGEKYPEIVYFEFVSLPEGSMSTRAGKFVSADALVEEVTGKAFDEVTTRRPELDEEVRASIARSVALAAIRYDIVKISPEKSTVFDWNEALDFERQSGPYIQYAHARACSILKKAGSFEEGYVLERESEITLAKHVAKFPYILELVVRELKPHILATYARELADLFNSFYHFEPVLKSSGETRRSRLTLVKATQNTLSEALKTLGIDALTSM